MSNTKHHSSLTTLERCRILLEQAENQENKTDIADVHSDGETLVATAHSSKKRKILPSKNLPTSSRTY